MAYQPKVFFFFGLGFMHEEKTKKLGAKDQVPCVMVIFEVKTTTKKQMSSAFYILYLYIWLCTEENLEKTQYNLFMFGKFK